MFMEVAWFNAEEREREYIDGRETRLKIDFFKEPLKAENVDKANNYDAVSIFLSSEINEEVLKKLDVNQIACRSTGVDHVDTEKAAEEGIIVSNVPEYGGTTVAEHTFGLILSLTRKIYRSIEKVEEGEFDHSGLRGNDLKGKKLGVIGTGTIGKNVIRIANGFDMHVVAYDPSPDREAEYEMGYMYVELEDLLEQADIVTLHCPLVEQTRHLLSRDEFELMEETVLINTARGELIDTEALIPALENGSVKSAGLDVLEEECYIEDDIEMLEDLEEECDPQIILEDHILMNRDDVIVTPHNAFNSEEALDRIIETTVDNLEKKSNVVNKPW
ncbi:MAG: D-lactate dehydrogenase [Candidatus Nanohaloarchaea archaeon]|jgi:D-lactate dehydrogenase